MENIYAPALQAFKKVVLSHLPSAALLAVTAALLLLTTLMLSPVYLACHPAHYCLSSVAVSSVHTDSLPLKGSARAKALSP